MRLIKLSKAEFILITILFYNLISEGLRDMNEKNIIDEESIDKVVEDS